MTTTTPCHYCPDAHDTIRMLATAVLRMDVPEPHAGEDEALGGFLCSVASDLAYSDVTGPDGLGTEDQEAITESLSRYAALAESALVAMREGEYLAPETVREIIRARLAGESAEPCEQCGGRGFLRSKEGERLIVERCDSCARFASDTEALDHVHKILGFPGRPGVV